MEILIAILITGFLVVEMSSCTEKMDAKGKKHEEKVELTKKSICKKAYPKLTYEECKYALWKE